MRVTGRLLAALVLAAGCGGAAQRPVGHTAVEREMASPAAQEVARDAPEAYAEVVRTAAAVEAGRAAPEEATLTFAWALTQARTAQARARATEAERRRAEAETDTTRMEQEAQRLDAEVTRLTEARRVAERARTAAAAPASVPRVERMAVAADLFQQAGLMVAAAQLLGAAPEARRTAEARVSAAAAALRGTDANAAFNSAGAAYTAAEALLRTARAGATATAHPTDPTALQQELSGAGGMEPHRDERGVIAVFRGLFTGAQMAVTARSRVETLARVIQGHPDAQVQLVVFAGGPARPAAETRARAQAAALSAALEHAGVPHDRLHAEGLYRAPGGAHTDDRVEVVLVLPTEP